MASVDPRAELECSVCLNIYTDPVNLRCGHNFCRVCIDRVLDTQEGSGGYSCPECREKFPDRPALHRNITLSNMLESLLSAQPDREESGVFCTHCVDSPVPAVRSCLHCEVSLCDKHLRVHKKSSEHVLCDPTLSMESRKCSVHKKILEYYCTQDETSICTSCCMIGGHKGHEMESLDEASEKKKETLRNVLQNLLTKRGETEERVQSLQEHKRNVEEKVPGDTERVTALFGDLRRRLEDLEKRVLREISGRAERISISIRDLEIKKEELSRKIRHIEELCNVTDPLTVLQESDTGYLCDTEDGDNGESDTGDLCDTDNEDDEESDSSYLCDTDNEDDEESDSSDLCDTDNEDDEESGSSDLWDTDNEDDEESDTGDLSDTEKGDNENRERHEELLHDGGGLDVAGISHTLHTLSDIITEVNVDFYIQGAADILLDVNTAYNYLQISDDGKTVSRSDIDQNRPKTPERFQDYQVLNTQSFSSGRHYWDVDVGGSDRWTVGMCYPSIDRRGWQSWIGYNNKSWGLDRSGNQYEVRHDNKKICLPIKILPKRVRIYLDYEAGRISFYALWDPIRHLHTFTTTFTEPLHAGFYVGGGRIEICGRNQKMWIQRRSLEDIPVLSAEKFPDRPALHRNITLRNIVENFMSAQPDLEESGVFCTYCVDSPVLSVTSCLLCEVSLCDKHLRVHKKSPEHILTDPTLSMESRKCSLHKKILEYYCTEDETCICKFCVTRKHKGHEMESLDEASEKKKEALKNVLQKLLIKREKTEERVQSLQEHRRKVEEKAAGDTERVSAQFRDLRRRLEDLEKRFLREISRSAERISISIRDLEIKKEELSRNIRHIEGLCNVMDPLTVLQESDMGDLCDTEDGDNEDRERHEKLLHDGGGLDLAGISHTLHTGLSDIITEINVYFYIQEAADILLDVNTAHNKIHISDDRKTVSRSDGNQNRPETPERFQNCAQVLSSQSFPSGRHYWEVDFGGSDWWIVGMCYPSIDRRGGLQSVIGYNNKSWGLGWNGDRYGVMHDSKVISLPSNISSNRVRIYLDYEAGRISFYDLCDPIRHLRTFTTTFTEPLHAGICVWRGCIKICGGMRRARRPEHSVGVIQ
ncbi:E3 ubiquitin/ISG15 ligase TRIM25-like [Lithobates pipiens]